MRSTASFSAAFAVVSVLVSSVAGLPIRRDATTTTSTPSNSDIQVLQFAAVLEEMESQFYTQALSKFQDSDFTTAGFPDPTIPAQQFQSIQSDESTHSSVLTQTIQSLGDQPIAGCSFDFSSVLTTVSSMLPAARLIENVGVGAYLGAAPLIQDTSILAAAASIATVEARHQTILNVLSDGTSIPQAFDIPLLPEEVVTIASPFISNCDLGIQSLNPLTVTNQGPIVPGTSLTFQAAPLNGIDPNTLSCQMLAGGMAFSLTLPFEQCVVPTGLNGPVLIYVTNDTQPLNGDVNTRFLGDVVAGPIMAFIDVQPETLGNIASGQNGTVISSSSLPGPVGVSNGTDIPVATATVTSTDSSETGAIINISTATTVVSTSTISPQDADSIIASATGTTLNLSSPTPSPVANVGSSNAETLPPSANPSTGPSPDGSLTVGGWTVVSSS